MERFWALLGSECALGVYTITKAEIDLGLKAGKGTSSKHPELQKRIKELGSIAERKETETFPGVEEYLDGIFQQKLVEYGEAKMKKTLAAYDEDLKRKFLQKEKEIRAQLGAQGVTSSKMSLASKSRFPTAAHRNVPPSLPRIIRDAGSRARAGRSTTGESAQMGNAEDAHSQRTEIAEQMIVPLETALPFFSSAQTRDLYAYLTGQSGPIEMLQAQFRKYVVKYEHPDSIREYVESHFHRGTHGFEMYNERFLYIELYHWVRCGMLKNALQLVRLYGNFFSDIAGGFLDAFLKWVRLITNTASGAPENVSPPDSKDTRGPFAQTVVDPFKTFFLGLFAEKSNPPREVICTIEDFVWYQMLLDKTLEASAPRGGGRRVPRKEVYRMVESSVSASKCLGAAILLGQWKSAAEILDSSRLGLAESLMIAYGVCLRVKREKENEFPIFRKSGSEGYECASLLLQLAQEACGLFVRPEDKLSLLSIVSPFLSSDWMEDLISEVFISTDDHRILGAFDAAGRKSPCTLGEYADVSADAVIDRVSGYYLESGNLKKALSVSYLGSQEKTVSVLEDVLIDKIQQGDYACSGLVDVVPHFSSPFVSLLWAAVEIGSAQDLEKKEDEESIMSKIKKCGILPGPNTESVLEKARELQSMSLYASAVWPYVLRILARALSSAGARGRGPHKSPLLQYTSDVRSPGWAGNIYSSEQSSGTTVEKQLLTGTVLDQSSGALSEKKEIASALLLLAGVLQVGNTVIQDIVGDLSDLL